MSMDQTFTIRQAAQEVGLTTKTIRYYETLGVVGPAKRKSNKYREYTTDDVARLRLVKQARALGLSLREIKPLVRHCIDENCGDLKTALVSQIPHYINSIEQKITDLKHLKSQFEKLNTSLVVSRDATLKSSTNCCSVIDELEQVNAINITSKR